MKSEFVLVTLIYFMAVFIGITFQLWLWGGLLTSSVKAISQDCGKEYPVEIYVISGNWFCSEDSSSD